MGLSGATALAALAAVVALVLLARQAVLRLPRGLGGLALPGRAGVLAVEQVLALDARRRLLLVRCDGRRLLLLTGGAQDVSLGWLDPPPPPAETAEGARATLPVAGLLAAAAALLLPHIAAAQSIALDLGAGGPGATSRVVQLTALVTLLSLAPSLLVMATAFTRIIIVLSLLRGALGAGATPPNTVLIGLALFLTFFVMQPVLDEAWRSGLLPLSQGRVDDLEGLRLAAEPFRRFMAAAARADDVRLFLGLAHLPDPPNLAATPWRALLPAFLVGELRRAFEMGFLLYLPFLVIDMVVASVLMGLGMMMLPPNVVSLPFKLIFFVLVDGWRLVSLGLVRSFVPG